MADEAPEATEADMLPAEQKNPWVKPAIILVLLVLIGQLAVVYVLVVYQIKPRYLGEEQVDEIGEVKPVQRDVVPVAAPFLYDVPDMTVNPQDEYTLRYLNVKMALEVDSQQTLSLLNDDPVVATRLLALLRDVLGQTPHREMDTSEKREPLRQRVMTAINTSGLLNAGSVTGVYFQRFILQ